MKKFSILILIVLLTAFGSDTWGQSFSVKGKIIELENGRPLVNVSIHAAKSNRNAYTNSMGIFEMSLSYLPDSLEISHVGFQSKQVTVTSTQQILEISLVPAVTQLNEVLVNTGYQMIKPNEINGSVIVIDNKILNRQSGPNILKRIEGVGGRCPF